MKLFTDGGARGNPGPAAIGAILYDNNGVRLDQVGAYLGESTNNEAEYKALVLGLKLAKRYFSGDLIACLDSELVVKQLKGEYQVKQPHLLVLFKEAEKLASGFDSVEFTHIRREENKAADKLVNDVLDLF